MSEAQAAIFAGAVLAELVIAGAGDRLALDAALRENRAAIDWIGRVAPPIWQRLKDLTQARRAQLASAPLPSPSPQPRSLP